MVSKKNLTFAASLGVMAVYLIAQTAMIVNPALSSLSAKYPEVPYSLILMISTLPSLVLIPDKIGGILSKLLPEMVGTVPIVTTAAGGFGFCC